MIKFLHLFFSLSELYTLEGNAFGKVCNFPFMYKDRWFGDCTTFDSSTKRSWCAIGTKYEHEQWGYCPTSCEYCIKDLLYLTTAVNNNHKLLYTNLVNIFNA